ncbi:olfactory receptor 1G1-like [Pleurodeles waltl]|uniref:olfactory receptor 1G1-like n=1 Tax=Pleurodeles waltl TaxID=8319 RepID=UPI0037093BA9
MGWQNHSFVTEFFLMGISQNPKLETVLFALFLIIYLATVLGNFLIISAKWLDIHLHTPMYFFLSNLSFVDVSYSSVTLPKMLSDFDKDKKSISYAGCLTQMYFFIFLELSESVLLAAMAYDRYVAVCKPLHYTSIMDRSVCIRLAAMSWSCGLLFSLVHTLLTTKLLFCGSNSISRFFCDVPPLFKLSCTDPFYHFLSLVISGGLIGFMSISIKVFSYVRIVSDILKIHSAEGRMKAFSTCASHLAVVTVFYGTLYFVYFRAEATLSEEKQTHVAVFYTMVIPLLNPIIYCLRNKEMKRAIRTIPRRKTIVFTYCFVNCPCKLY